MNIEIRLPRDPKAAFAIRRWAAERGLPLAEVKKFQAGGVGRRPVGIYPVEGPVKLHWRQRGPKPEGRFHDGKYPYHCRHGHLIAGPGDLRVFKKRNYSECRACHNVNRRAYQARKKALRSGVFSDGPTC